MNHEYDLYNKADHTARVEDLFLTRRQWLTKTGSGFGALALSCMLAEQGFAQAKASGGALAPKQPPQTPKAKRVLNIFLQGAAPHMDLWDPRPELNANGGKAQGNRKLLASPFKFPKYGKSGLQFSERTIKNKRRKQPSLFASKNQSGFILPALDTEPCLR